MTSHQVCEYTPPTNFSWIVEGKLAAMGWPQTVSNLKFILCQGIKNLVTLSAERRPPICAVPQITWMEIPVEEFQPPTIQQICCFIKICEECNGKNEAVGVHCRQGKGRTGVMAACYLVYFYNLPPERAILNIRLQRPGSVETYAQENIVKKYHDYLRGTK